MAAGEWSRRALLRFFGRSGPRLSAAVAYYVLLLAAAVLLAASAGATIADRVAQSQAVDPLGLPGVALAVARVVVPVAQACGVLVILLRWVPSNGPRLRHVRPPALIGAVALWALTFGFPRRPGGRVRGRRPGGARPAAAVRRAGVPRRAGALPARAGGARVTSTAHA